MVCHWVAPLDLLLAGLSGAHLVDLSVVEKVERLAGYWVNCLAVTTVVLWVELTGWRTAVHSVVLMVSHSDMLKDCPWATNLAEVLEHS